MAKQAVPRMVASRKPAGTDSLGMGWEDGRDRRVVRRGPAAPGLGQRPQDFRAVPGRCTQDVLSAAKGQASTFGALSCSARLSPERGLGPSLAAEQPRRHRDGRGVRH